MKRASLDPIYGCVALGIPVALLAACGALLWFAAPEHDDYCIAAAVAKSGFIPAIVNLYQTGSGRLPALALIQAPEWISSAFSVPMLSTYRLVLAAIFAGFLVGSLVAFARFCRQAGIAVLLVLASTFAATCIAVSPSPHEMLYWLPGSACYIPPAIVAIFFLAELFALNEVKAGHAWAMSLLGFAAAMFNEFTGIWLLLILLGSIAARFLLNRPPQLTRHTIIALAIIAGFVIIVAAPGNSQRQAVMPNSGHFWSSAGRGFSYSFYCLVQLLSKPACIAMLSTVALLGMKFAQRTDRRSAIRLASIILATSLACCYFEFFAHEYATGIRLVERAQNQALILLLFGLSLAAYTLGSAFRIPLADRRIAPMAISLTTALCLVVSPTALLIRAQVSTFEAFHRETIARDRLLRTTETTDVYRHNSTPSLLMGNDVDISAACFAGYYGRAHITILAPQS